MKKSAAVAVIMLAVLAAYAPAALDGFVWDDTALILRDPLIRSWRLIPEGFNHFLFTDATASDFYRPIQRLSYTLEYAAFAFRPGPYHVTNILLQAMAAAALFVFAGELLRAFGLPETRRRWIALIATTAWAIHPVQSAAVIYVSGRADPLAALFGFAGCYLILRALPATPRRQLLWISGGALLFLLSALSKETGLIFPALTIALLLLMKKRNLAWKTLAAAVFVATAYLSLRLPAEHNPAPVLRPPPPLAMRPIMIARAMAEYAGLVVLPLNLHMDRRVDAPASAPTDTNLNPPAWRELQTLLGILLVVAAMYWMLRVRQRDQLVFILLSLAALTYLPVSGVVTLNASVAEHWIYLPSAFFFLAATVATANLVEKHQARSFLVRATTLALACWLIFLGTRTFFRTFDWKDQRTFLERTIAAGGNSSRMLTNLGGLESSAGQFDLAKKHVTEALSKEPDQPFAVINLAVIALKQNDFKTARQLLEKATQLPVVDAQAYELLAFLENKEKGQTNPLRMRLAARTGPSNWTIEKRYIMLIAETGGTEAAIRELQTCLRTEWYRAESWQLLSDLLTKFGRTNEAANALMQANAYDVHLLDHGTIL